MIEHQQDLINDTLIKFDKRMIEKRIKDLEEILKELQKTNNGTISKVVVEAFNKTINELKEAKEQIENSIE
jgi:hypothetical protein